MCAAVGATMLIAKGRPSKLDLWKFSQESPPNVPSQSTPQIDVEVGSGSLEPAESGTKPMWSFLSLSWGIISDVDIESEAIRCVGALRFTLWAVLRVLTLRQYAATLHYQDAQSGEWLTMSATDFLGLCARSAPLGRVHIPSALRPHPTWDSTTTCVKAYLPRGCYRRGLQRPLHVFH